VVTSSSSIFVQKDMGACTYILGTGQDETDTKMHTNVFGPTKTLIIHFILCAFFRLHMF